jgi:hypothetical protein
MRCGLLSISEVDVQKMRLKTFCKLTEVMSLFERKLFWTLIFERKSVELWGEGVCAPLVMRNIPLFNPRH